jgi:hypothetical protein
MPMGIRSSDLSDGSWRLAEVVFLLMVLQGLEPKIGGGDLAVYPLSKPVGDAAVQLRSGGVAHVLLLGRHGDGMKMERAAAGARSGWRGSCSRAEHMVTDYAAVIFGLQPPL